LRVDVNIPLALHADVLLADVASDLLGVLHGALADFDLLGDDGILGDVDLLLTNGDADFLTAADVAGRGLAAHRPALDNDLLPLNGESIVLCSV